MTSPSSTASDLAAPQHLAKQLVENVAQVVRGRPDAVRAAVAALLSGGHLLIEDVPGNGKTLLAKALARSIGGSFRRIQGTPDLLPSEITGVSVFSKSADDWQFRPGPLFANVVLADEINRATPRSQSALLEAMEEGQVTVDGTTWALPEPFFMVATQNPLDSAGTFPLVDSQRDRFALVIELGHLGRDAERDLLLGVGGSDHLDEVQPVTDAARLAASIAAVRTVHCEPVVATYIVDICAATRAHPDIRLGASPRAALAVLHAAKAWAVMSGRTFVIPDDVKALVLPALAHRMTLPAGAGLVESVAVLRDIVERVPVPRT